MMTTASIKKFIPGLQLFRDYRREWWQSDIVAGLSLAAVALPVGIAYAQLVGFPPVIGIYSCILPPVAYAFFGSSRQLVVNPDSAACMIIAATIAPLALGDPTRYVDLAILLSLITGILCMIGGMLKLGVIANFLSLPILTGYLNGIALSIIASQLGTLLGFEISKGGFFHTIQEAFARLDQTHIYTLILFASLFLVIRLLKKFVPKMPSALITTIIGILAVYFFGLADKGVKIVGEIPAGFVVPHIPAVVSSELYPLILGAGGIMLVSFCSMMTTERAFAAKNGYRINVNQDMFALGVSDIASGLSGGFAVSGADSRTAVADSSGGKTQMTSIVGAAVIAIVLLFLTSPLALVPSAALAAILISSAFALFDIKSLKRYFSLSKSEFAFSIIATVGVMTVGVLPGVLIAVALALFNLLRLTSRPHDAILGEVRDQPGVYASNDKGEHYTEPGIIIYRFDASILFFNADYFKDRVMHAVSNSKTKVIWFIFDTESIPMIDITGCQALSETNKLLVQNGITMILARSKGLFKNSLIKYGIFEEFGEQRVFPSIRGAVQAVLSENLKKEASPPKYETKKIDRI